MSHSIDACDISENESPDTEISSVVKDVVQANLKNVQESKSSFMPEKRDLYSSLMGN